jgi:glycosyltransferase involved in cell wall biosynthesis
MVTRDLEELLYTSKTDGAFVIPFYRTSETYDRYLEEVVESLARQTNSSWEAVIVVDGEDSRISGSLLKSIQSEGRFTIIENPERLGSGASRNVGVEWAAENNHPTVLFLDADDVAHPERLARTIDVFANRDDVDFVYSSFDVINEHGDPIGEKNITPSIVEILHSHRHSPIGGSDAWIPIGTKVGYTTLTSTVAVRTELALACPFPHPAASADTHTWYRMSASGKGFAFVDTNLTKYRLPSSTGGATTRARYGDAYYWMKAQVDLDGFTRAMAIAIDRGKFLHRNSGAVMRSFYHRLAATLETEGMLNTADCLRGLAITDGRNRE